MQNSQLILVSSVAALLLCALPYGCGGKAAESGSGNNAGMAGTRTVVIDGWFRPVDGSASTGSVDGLTTRVDGSTTTKPVDGSTCDPCNWSDGEGDGYISVDGRMSDGRMSDGMVHADGMNPEGANTGPDGAVDSWSDGSP